MRNITARENCDNFNKLLISNLKVEALDICFMNGETSTVWYSQTQTFSLVSQPDLNGVLFQKTYITLI